MIEKAIEIKMPDGVCDGFLYEAEDGRRLPGVIDFPDIVGVRPAARETSRRLAEAGYTVLLPNPFYRTSRSPVFDFKPNFGGDDRTMKRFADLATPLTPEAVARDASAYVDFLAAQKTVSNAKMGVTGHCFTGMVALRIAATRPERIAALAAFHAGRLFLDTPTSPHLVLPRVQAQLLFVHAKDDHSMPAPAVEKFEAALAAWGGKYESETVDAHHGFTVPDSAAYEKADADRAFEKMTTLFAETLK